MKNDPRVGRGAGAFEVPTSRRGFISSALTAVGVVGLGGRAAARGQEKAPPIFAQMLGSDVPYIGHTDDGPLYPPTEIAWRDDLTRTEGVGGRAKGDPVCLFGRVLDSRGAPLPDTAVEIWQADANGNYRHPAAWKQDELDPAFGYFGKVKTDARGFYRFRTIRPRRYEVFGIRRAAHIHMKIRHSWHGVMTTEAYFDNEEHRRWASGDAVFQSRPEWLRGRVVLPERTAKDFKDLPVELDADAICCNYDLAYWL